MMNSRLVFLFWFVAINAGTVSAVECGNHHAPTCAQCPQGNGAVWCNGECIWRNNQCGYTKICGGDDTASSCAQCPPGKDGCIDENAPFDPDSCAWHPSTGLCRDAFSDNVRTASVHLEFSSPISKPAWLFQRVIPIASEDATYFATNGHSYGYGGIQQVNDSYGQFIFSLWDQGGCDQDIGECDEDNLAKTIACGDGVTCESFGNEGTGRKSEFQVDNFPIINEEYYFVTQAAYLGNRRMEYTGYFYFEGNWKLLSRIQVSTNQSEEWWLKGLYTFVEQWDEVDTTKDRAALFGPAFMASEDGGTFIPVAGASFDYGTLENHEHVNAWQEGSNLDYAIGIETGGKVFPEAEYGTYFSYAERAPYNELISFQEKIPCLNDAGTKNEIDACLSQATPNPTKSPVSTPNPVSCGGHFAPTCAECPQVHGAAWCNGQCIWRNNQCIHEEDEPTRSPTKSPVSTSSPTESPTKSPVSTPSPTESPTKAPVSTPAVSCGSHFAPTCAECPQGNGAAWCNGECVWENNQCIHEDDEQCEDNENWRWVNKRGKVKDCAWVARKSDKRCRRRIKGYYAGAEDVEVLSKDGCPVTCNTNCRSPSRI